MNKTIDSKILKMRDGISNLDTIRFGKIPEIMIKLLNNYSYANGTSDYDLIKDKTKIEVKFSFARQKETTDINESNALTVCIDNSEIKERGIETKDRNNIEFDCNIQQIKPDLFDILVYGVFFNDSIAIFEMDKEFIQNNFNLKSVDYYKPISHEFTYLYKSIKNKNIKDLNSADKKKIKSRLEKMCSFSTDNIINENPIFTKTDINRFKEFKKDLDIDFENKFDEYKDFVDSIHKRIIPNLSPNQHKGNNNEGQFHITNENIEWHETHNTSTKWISYEELFNLLKNVKK